MTDNPRRTAHNRYAMQQNTLREPAHWTPLAAGLALLLLVAGLWVRITARIEYVGAAILTTTPAQIDDGSRAVYTARDVRGHTFPLVIRDSRAPALLTPGEIVRLKVQTDPLHRPRHSPACL